MNVTVLTNREDHTICTQRNSDLDPTRGRGQSRGLASGDDGERFRTRHSIFHKAFDSTPTSGSQPQAEAFGPEGRVLDVETYIFPMEVTQRSLARITPNAGNARKSGGNRGPSGGP